MTDLRSGTDLIQSPKSSSPPLIFFSHTLHHGEGEIKVSAKCVSVLFSVVSRWTARTLVFLVELLLQVLYR